MKRRLGETKKLDPNYLAIVLLVIIWKTLLIFVLIAAFEFIPLYSPHLLGGGINNYTERYYFYPWANFDGEHFTAIAQFGYQQYTQAFFPLYPYLISFGKYFSGDMLLSLVISGLLVSSISLFLGLIFFYKLLKLDYSPNFSLGVILLLLVFPTAFYFNGVYTESLFFMLITGSFLFFRKKQYLLAGIFGCLASLTRVFGVLIFISFLIEIWQFRLPLSKTFWILLIPAGLLSYMIYLYYSVGDPLAFYNLQLIVGEQHQRGVVLFPQILYRYLKIVINFDSLNPLFTTILLELAIGIVFMILPIIGFFKRIRLSYIFFAFMGYVLPTIQGSFSSLPRYVLILFPSFIILALLVKPLPVFIKICLFVMSSTLLIIEAGLFLRGYWVS
jgi:Gpi18-like mannosyltransferase